MLEKLPPELLSLIILYIGSLKDLSVFCFAVSKELRSYLPYLVRSLDKEEYKDAFFPSNIYRVYPNLSEISGKMLLPTARKMSGLSKSKLRKFTAVTERTLTPRVLAKRIFRLMGTNGCSKLLDVAVESPKHGTVSGSLICNIQSCVVTVVNPKYFRMGRALPTHLKRSVVIRRCVEDKEKSRVDY